jgi:hypothetical protein
LLPKGGPLATFHKPRFRGITTPAWDIVRQNYFDLATNLLERFDGPLKRGPYLSQQTVFL